MARPHDDDCDRDLESPAAWTVPEAPGEAFSFWQKAETDSCQQDQRGPEKVRVKLLGEMLSNVKVPHEVDQLWQWVILTKQKLEVRLPGLGLESSQLKSYREVWPRIVYSKIIPARDPKQCVCVCVCEV